jgi:hypothetical protein
VLEYGKEGGISLSLNFTRKSSFYIIYLKISGIRKAFSFENVRILSTFMILLIATNPI